MKKLAAIYNVFDGVELLKYSMRSMESKVDVFIIVFQNISNYGEHYAPLSHMELDGFEYILKFYTPEIGSGTKNEIAKRNLGLQVAKDIGCTHFLMVDCDEIYQDFRRAVEQYLMSGCKGSVCKMFTYFKLPTLRFEHFDNYYVPFIHELNPDTVAGVKEYPFYVDPTRKINCKDVVLIDEPMHHFSYVRRNIHRKMRNSSAKVNIERSKIYEDWVKAEHGYHVQDFFNQRLVEVENIFGIIV